MQQKRNDEKPTQDQIAAIDQAYQKAETVYDIADIAFKYKRYPNCQKHLVEKLLKGEEWQKFMPKVGNLMLLMNQLGRFKDEFATKVVKDSRWLDKLIVNSVSLVSLVELTASTDYRIHLAGKIYQGNGLFNRVYQESEDKLFLTDRFPELDIIAAFYGIIEGKNGIETLKNALEIPNENMDKKVVIRFLHKRYQESAQTKPQEALREFLVARLQEYSLYEKPAYFDSAANLNTCHKQNGFVEVETNAMNLKVQIT